MMPSKIERDPKWSSLFGWIPAPTFRSRLGRIRTKCSIGFAKNKSIFFFINAVLTVLQSTTKNLAVLLRLSRYALKLMYIPKAKKVMWKKKNGMEMKFLKFRR